MCMYVLKLICLCIVRVEIRVSVWNFSNATVVSLSPCMQGKPIAQLRKLHTYIYVYMYLNSCSHMYVCMYTNEAGV